MDKAKLKDFIDRILPLEEEKKGLSDDIMDGQGPWGLIRR
jgi:uncharacterized protein (UPF0335 family)